MPKVSLFWFRRDLRLFDNAGLYHALKSPYPVLPIFIFDTTILDKLSDKKDKRVQFIWKETQALKKELEQNYNSSLCIRYGKPKEVYAQLLEEYDVQMVFTNRDYEPSAIERDKGIYELLKERDIPFKGYKDHVIFDKNEVLKDDGTPYTVYSPYMRKWKQALKPKFHLKSYPTLKYFNNFWVTEPLAEVALANMGFEEVHSNYPERAANFKIVRAYNKTRDYPSIQGTTRLSLHLRFGTISIRELAQSTKDVSEKYYNELIWREFYQMILYHFPHTVNQSFKPKYDRIVWDNNEDHFKKWCEGKTGYPIVDAGMRELNETGYMHNRVRMIVASFLTKDLLLDWRWGEAYFAQKLLDYDQASNVGGWQWAAGSGVDAAPYFRIFNPYSQAEKFDPEEIYIKRWIPEYGTSEYPDPIVNHKLARERCLERYKEFI